MKRSQINGIYREAAACFERHGWALPPAPRWDSDHVVLFDDPTRAMLMSEEEEIEPSPTSASVPAAMAVIVWIRADQGHKVRVCGPTGASCSGIAPGSGRRPT